MRQLETQPLVQSYNNRSVPKLFRSYLRNSNNKTNLVKCLFQKEREALPNTLTSFQTIHLTNLDGATDRVTSQSSEINGVFFATTKKLTQKCFCILSSFVIIFIRAVSPLLCQTLMLPWYLYMKVLLTLH